MTAPTPSHQTPPPNHHGSGTCPQSCWNVPKVVKQTEQCAEPLVNATKEKKMYVFSKCFTVISDPFSLSVSLQLSDLLINRSGLLSLLNNVDIHPRLYSL